MTRGKAIFCPLEQVLKASLVKSRVTKNQKKSEIITSFGSTNYLRQKLVYGAKNERENKAKGNHHKKFSRPKTTCRTPFSFSPAIAEFCSNKIDFITEKAINVDKCSRCFEQIWPDVVDEIISTTLGELNDEEKYMEKCLDNLFA